MINVECLAPKKASGNHEFPGFVDFALWLNLYTQEGKNVGPMCQGLAELGSWEQSKTGFKIKVTSDITLDYFTLRDLAEKIGVLKMHNAGKDPYRRDPEVGLEFVTELDKLSSTQAGT